MLKSETVMIDYEPIARRAEKENRALVGKLALQREAIKHLLRGEVRMSQGGHGQPSYALKSRDSIVQPKTLAIIQRAVDEIDAETMT